MSNFIRFLYIPVNLIRSTFQGDPDAIEDFRTTFAFLRRMVTAAYVETDDELIVSFSFQSLKDKVHNKKISRNIAAGRVKTAMNPDKETRLVDAVAIPKLEGVAPEVVIRDWVERQFAEETLEALPYMPSSWAKRYFVSITPDDIPAFPETAEDIPVDLSFDVH